MTGTSADGIDVGLLGTDGNAIARMGRATTYPFGNQIRDELRATFGGDMASGDLVRRFTALHIEAVRDFMVAEKLAPQDIRAVGFHGQTIFHDPQRGVTVQIGDGEYLARNLGIDVVDQFRTEDVENGGQGAPLAPVYHGALLATRKVPAAIVNIGGIANVTWTDGERYCAFDSGIGNARIDDWVSERTGARYDADGLLGLRGNVDEAIVGAALADPYYLRQPPKSLDRDELLVSSIDGLSLEDGAATLAAVTADAIARSVQFLPAAPEEWIIAGGGRLNQAIMRRLRAKIAQPILVAEDAGIDGDAVEAHLMAYLAARFIAGLPSTYPQTTGVRRPVICGRLHSHLDANRQ